MKSGGFYQPQDAAFIDIKFKCPIPRIDEIRDPPEKLYKITEFEVLLFWGYM